MNTTILKIATLTGTLLGMSNVYATDVYSQSPTSNIIDTSAVANLPADPGFTWSLDQDEENWTYFTAPSTASFNQITWYGTNADGKFAVDFYQAACFSCGANWVQTDGTFSNNLLPNQGPFDQSAITKTQISAGLYAYSLDLSAPVTLNQGSLYALSVVNNYTALPFSWAGANNGSGFHLHYIVGQAMFLKAPGSLAFTLTDTIPAVPEPNGSALMIAGLLMTNIALRRLKKS